MREGISYSFLLNIVILFVFVCVAIIGGILSYYRAFRANTIIVNEIEKYEGYNCESISSISQKLSNIAYSLPFEATCKDNYGKPCKVSDDGNYVIVAYNLDIDENTQATNHVADPVEFGGRGYYLDDEMNSYVMTSVSVAENVNKSTKKYQYGVYTYMYVDLPVVSKLLKIPFFSKTKQMHEFRDLKYGLEPDEVKGDEFYIVNMDIIPTGIVEDVTSYYKDHFDIENEDYSGFNNNQEEINNAKAIYSAVNQFMRNREYLNKLIEKINENNGDSAYIYDPEKWGMGKKYVSSDFNMRDAYIYYGFQNKEDLDIDELIKTSTHECGFRRDWSIY